MEIIHIFMENCRIRKKKVCYANGITDLKNYWSVFICSLGDSPIFLRKTLEK